MYITWQLCGIKANVVGIYFSADASGRYSVIWRHSNGHTWWLHICCRQCLMPAPRVTQFGQWLLVKHDFQEPCCTFYFFIFFCCCSCQLSGRCDSRCLTIIKHGCIISIIITIIIYSIELENWIPKRPRLKSCQSSQGDTAQCCSPWKNISKMPVFMTRNG